MQRPNVPEVAPLVAELYKRNAVGCCLHIVLDDGNVSNRHVDFCIAWARDKGHKECEHLAKKLRLMSTTQRRKLYVRKREL
jgi:hypothetical protein